MKTKLRDRRQGKHKLAAFRKIWEVFVTICMKIFVSNKTMMVNEYLIAFRGKYPFSI